MKKRLTALILALCLVLTLALPVFAVDTAAQPVKKAVFLGDSLSLGFTMDPTNMQAAYDYERCLHQATNNYNWAYPYRFGELVYGKDSPMYDPNNVIEGADYEVHESVYNYGISGAMAEDIYNLLSNGDELTPPSATNVLRNGFMGVTGDMSDFFAGMRDDVADADMVAVAIGGNDIYQNFSGSSMWGEPVSFQTKDQSELGQIFTMLSSALMFNTNINDIVTYYGDYLNLDVLKGIFGLTETGGMPNMPLLLAQESAEEPVMAMEQPEAAEEAEEVTEEVAAAAEEAEEVASDSDLVMMMAPKTLTTGKGFCQHGCAASTCKICCKDYKALAYGKLQSNFGWFNPTSMKMNSKAAEALGNLIKGVAKKAAAVSKDALSDAVTKALAELKDQLVNSPMMVPIQEWLGYYSNENINNYFTVPGENGYSIYDIWETNYDGIINRIKASNTDGQIVLISQFNPFGAQNYQTLMQQRMAKSNFLSGLGKEANTAGRILRTLLSELGSAQSYAGNESLWLQKVGQALQKAVNELLPLIGEEAEMHYYTYTTDMYGWPMSMVEGSYLSLDEYKAKYGAERPDVAEANFYFTGRGGFDYTTWEWDDNAIQVMASPLSLEELIASSNPEWGMDYSNAVLIDDAFRADPANADVIAALEAMYPSTKSIVTDEDNEAIYDLLGELAYPMMVYMVGNGLQNVYNQMNEHMKELAAADERVVYVDISNAPSNGRFDPHPNQNGHDWIAQAIYDQLRKINGGTAFKGGNGGNGNNEHGKDPCYPVGPSHWLYPFGCNGLYKAWENWAEFWKENYKPIDYSEYYKACASWTDFWKENMAKWWKPVNPEDMKKYPWMNPFSCIGIFNPLNPMNWWHPIGCIDPDWTWPEWWKPCKPVDPVEPVKPDLPECDVLDIAKLMVGGYMLHTVLDTDIRQQPAKTTTTTNVVKQTNVTSAQTADQTDLIALSAAAAASVACLGATVVYGKKKEEI